MGISTDFILGLSGSVIVILLAIIAFFLKGLLDKFDKMTLAPNDLKTTTSVQQTACKFMHTGIDARLDAHSKSIDKINNRLEIKS
jgi:hypothetical protein